MTVLISFLKLPGEDQKLLLHTLFLMVKYRLMLWLMPFFYIKRSVITVNTIKTVTPVLKLAWSVRIISHYVPYTTCLTNALTGHDLLSKHGYPSLIKIGVGKSTEGKFEAHAWLEYDEKVVIGASEKDYVTLYDFHG